MKSKSPKVYTLSQVGSMLGVTDRTVYNYVNAGLIPVLPSASGRNQGRTVTEAEYQRLKRDGVNTAGMMAKLAGRGVGGRPAAKKKSAKGKAAAAPATAKKSVKKPVKRSAAATKKAAKKRSAR